jgi:glycogen debranching enzyme
MKRTPRHLIATTFLITWLAACGGGGGVKETPPDNGGGDDNGNGGGSDGGSGAGGETPLPPQPVSSIRFVDTDDDAGELAGKVIVGAASDEQNIRHYTLYWSNSSGAELVFIGNLAKGSASIEFVLPDNTAPPEGATHWLAYAVSADKMRSAPTLVAFNDHIDEKPQPPAAPRGISFTDTDKDANQYSGTVLVTRANDEAQVQTYVIGWIKADNTWHSPLVTLDKTNATLQYNLAANTVLPVGASNLGAFTQNASGEASAIVALAKLNDLIEITETPISSLSVSVPTAVSKTDINVAVQISPRGAASEVAAYYSLDSKIWNKIDLTKNPTGNNESWSGTLGRFACSSQIQAYIEAKDKKGALTRDDNQKAMYTTKTEPCDTVTKNFDGNTVTAKIIRETNGLREYNITTDQVQRADTEKNRTVTERAEDMTIRTGNTLFDALFAMALDDARQNTASEIRDWNYNNGANIPCNCYQTGEKWTYVWTRDTAYSAHLALAQIDPERMRNSLQFKLSNKKAAAASHVKKQIVQDTGSGGSWPVSTDRVVWALGAWETLKFLTGKARDDFRDEAYDAIKNTIEVDRRMVFDERDGLYRGEQSFLDWREQTNPQWTANSVVHIAMAKSLSTNVGHWAILDIAAKLAEEKQDFKAYSDYTQMADKLKTAINQRFWNPALKMYSTVINTDLDGSASSFADMLGNALAISLGIPDNDEKKNALAWYPHTHAGPPVLWPQHPDAGVYHNRAVWPFVTAYALRAARVMQNDAITNINVESLMAGAGLNLSNMENLHYLTRDPRDPKVNSRRQLWSVAGYLSMVLDTIFGRDTDAKGIRFRPFITNQIRNTLFANTDIIRLNNMPYRGNRLNIEIKLPKASNNHDGFIPLDSMSYKLDNKAIGDEYLPFAMSGGNHTLHISLIDAGTQIRKAYMTHMDDRQESRRTVAPTNPVLRGDVTKGPKGKPQIQISNFDPSLRYNIYRDGKLIKSGVTTALWEDNEPGIADTIKQTHCYTAEAEWAQNDGASAGLKSFHANPVCYWGWHAQTVSQMDFAAASNYKPPVTGLYYLQIPYTYLLQVDTGVACGVRQIKVIDTVTGSDITNGKGYIVMPQHGQRGPQDASDSNFVAVRLDANKTYRIEVSNGDAFNMSSLEHNTKYARQDLGGGSGVKNDPTYSQIKFLLMKQE